MNRFLRFFPIISLAMLFALWYLISIIVGSEFLFPSPSAVFADLGEFFLSEDFFPSLFGSLYRIALSFAAALILAFLFAMLAYKSIIAQKLLQPFVLLSRSTPTMSLIFICLIWFSSYISPMVVSFAVLFPLLYSAFSGALFGVDEKLIEMTVAYGFSRANAIKNLYIPFVAKTAYPQVAGALSFNVKLIIAGEAWAQTAKSLGRVMYKANVNLETARLFAATIVALALSFALELLLNGIRKLSEKIRYAKINKYN